jgi:hypothetical protein
LTDATEAQEKLTGFIDKAKEVFHEKTATSQLKALFTDCAAWSSKAKALTTRLRDACDDIADA